MSRPAGFFVASTFVVFGLLLPGSNAKAQQVVGLNTLQALTVTTPKPGSDAVPGDFNGDGLSDLLWFNADTSQLAYWIMATDANGEVTRTSSRTIAVTPGYFIGATGDLNGDGLADIVFTGANHDLYLWTNSGKGSFHSTSLGTYPAGWQLFGAGDIDGDGQDDLLWLNSGTCQFAYWLMKSGKRVGSRTLPVTCGSYPLSIGYYSLSNRLSIVWTNAAHDLFVWDATADGFNSYSFDNYTNGGTDPTFLAFGGGYAGGDMSYVLSPSPGSAFGQSLERAFFIGGEQDTYARTTVWTGGVNPVSAGGFLIEGRQVNKTGNIYRLDATHIGVCPPVSPRFGSYESGPTAAPADCVPFSFPSGWILIGADNGVVPTT
ncbi:FG-GAP repeat domain-containing protein [Dyella lutea]|uniref:VCBS repeat-containing protein n=1 Tax=Dyella lutea TaxID=2950441 RepID=A0ABT1F7L8_9GAMM|nr:VCBS repeat-containing protein [Dyella lutea]MCP1373381.1 VCBS repeat-containing protein [Dyella lutea]